MSSPSPSTLPTDTELAARLRLAVMRLARRLRQEVQAQELAGVTPSQLSALSSIGHLGPITLGELSAAERVQPPTMTRIVDGLEALGFVTRTIDAKDRRVVRVTVTPEGQRFLNRSRTRRNAFLAARLRRLDPSDRQVLDHAVALLEGLVGEDEGRADR